MRQHRHASRPSVDEGFLDERAYVLSLTAQQLAHLIGGDPLTRDSRGREGAQGPGPGHSPEDRSMAVRIDPESPVGFTVSTFSPRDDWRNCKDYVRRRLGLTPWGPGTFRRAHAPHNATKEDLSHNASRARWLWEHSQPAPGTPVER